MITRHPVYLRLRDDVPNEASARLEEGGSLLAVLPRRPELLIPHLRERGLAWSLLEFAGGALLLLRRPEDSDAH